MGVGLEVTRGSKVAGFEAGVRLPSVSRPWILLGYAQLPGSMTEPTALSWLLLDVELVFGRLPGWQLTVGWEQGVAAPPLG